MSKSISKASIVQRLLDKKQITAEEAVLLLEASRNYVTYNPYDVQFSNRNDIRCIGVNSTWPVIQSTNQDK